ncbi:hypothetical protein FGB62_68g169 [Gracilaria domingensis]|nr:hypothetical protein FGB62_68g169 [Gracilaria domingensis]
MAGVSLLLTSDARLEAVSSVVEGGGDDSVARSAHARTIREALRAHLAVGGAAAGRNGSADEKHASNGIARAAAALARTMTATTRGAHGARRLGELRRLQRLQRLQRSVQSCALSERGGALRLTVGRRVDGAGGRGWRRDARISVARLAAALARGIGGLSVPLAGYLPYVALPSRVACASEASLTQVGATRGRRGALSSRAATSSVPLCGNGQFATSLIGGAPAVLEHDRCGESKRCGAVRKRKQGDARRTPSKLPCGGGGGVADIADMLHTAQAQRRLARAASQRVHRAARLPPDVRAFPLTLRTEHGVDALSNRADQRGRASNARRADGEEQHGGAHEGGDDDAEREPERSLSQQRRHQHRHSVAKAAKKSARAASNQKQTHAVAQARPARRQAARPRRAGTRRSISKPLRDGSGMAHARAPL